MLTHLRIQGLAIIESLNIEFARGFNVITGETGAGKSILIKALGLLLGAKSSTESVRKGFEQATVCGRFVVRPNHPALGLLVTLGVVAEDDESGSAIIVRRLVTAKGRSSAWINDVPVTTATLKQLSETLIDVFGQHDNHRLLDVAFHSHYLDQFVESKDLPLRLESKWREAAGILGDLRSFVEKMKGKGPDNDYLNFMLGELKQFQPSQEDFSEVQSLNERARSSMGITTAIQTATSALEDESGISVAKRMREISRALLVPKIGDLQQLATEATKIAEAIDDLSFSLGRFAGRVEISEEDIDRAESRIAGYQSLFRKHHATDAESLLEQWQKLESQMNAFSDATGHVGQLLNQFESAVTGVLTLALQLSNERRDAVDQICQRVERELADLAMPGAKFSVEMEPIIRSVAAIDLAGFDGALQSKLVSLMDDWTCVSEHGSERAQFYLASNKGEPSLPLTKVASGGEISRIMLALKKALVVGAETCVLVFDEIDTGISGRIADTVGRKIAELADFCQIICISHLPQVAAYADTHYIVEKKQKGDRTESNIRPVLESERYHELARILSGNKVSNASLEHAKNLVFEAHQKLKNTKPIPIKNLKVQKRKPASAAAKRKTRK